MLVMYGKCWLTDYSIYCSCSRCPLIYKKDKTVHNKSVPVYGPGKGKFKA